MPADTVILDQARWLVTVCGNTKQEYRTGSDIEQIVLSLCVTHWLFLEIKVTQYRYKLVFGNQLLDGNLPDTLMTHSG